MNNISSAVIRRLPRYYRYLGDLLDSGVERISSSELSRRMNVTASQIRQDLNNFGGFGMQGYGYNVAYLYEEIGKILGVDVEHNVVVIGCGNIGKAMINYPKFVNIGFKTIGAFDVDSSLIGTEIRGVRVQSISELEDFVKSNKVDVAVLSLPKAAAVDIAESLVNLGVKGFWNFCHIDLDVEDDVVVENVHLSDSLMRLSYSLSEKNN